MDIISLHIPLDLVYIVRSTFDRYKTNPVNMIDLSESPTATQNGVQTENILKLSDFCNDGPFYRTLHRLRRIAEQQTGFNFELRHIHMIEYNYGGYQTPHTHDHNEDYSCILYLNTCDDGETRFPDHGINHFPEEGKMVIFPATAYHGASETTSGKKILVMGFNKINISFEDHAKTY